MALHEAETQRAKRRDSRSSDRRDDRTKSDEDGPPNGVFLVAALAFLGGAADLLFGIAMLPTPVAVFGVFLAALGALECWVAIGLFRLQARALGLAVVLYGMGALIDGLRLLFALGTGGSAGGPAARILLAAVVVGYLLVRADHFE
ncbi:hypothetical protein U4E84_17655 [Halorubrum sp. AD140]|uniref:hypothetical protein n=1 Tax=Halorubrum sp. AD140 TaxID=3050073 RepID=UPI002ACCA990|nr:hypothetical protein [Halorubrum sp. AD140]MDZ5813158.1 hypothetical protein [Halorubrum sp. AD140]